MHWSLCALYCGRSTQTLICCWALLVSCTLYSMSPIGSRRVASLRVGSRRCARLPQFAPSVRTVSAAPHLRALMLRGAMIRELQTQPVRFPGPRATWCSHVVFFSFDLSGFLLRTSFREVRANICDVPVRFVPGLTFCAPLHLETNEPAEPHLNSSRLHVVFHSRLLVTGLERNTCIRESGSTQDRTHGHSSNGTALQLWQREIRFNSG